MNTTIRSQLFEYYSNTELFAHLWCACHRLALFVVLFVSCLRLRLFVGEYLCLCVFICIYLSLCVGVFVNLNVSPQPFRLFLLLHRHPVVFFVLFVPRSRDRLNRRNTFKFIRHRQEISSKIWRIDKKSNGLVQCWSLRF